ncbi:uncharacterized protein [Amphiura filiformis]|uniref:uncharacterized protein n=1 Tax=Amphiura filiformis TaxID=82378 RepID=UPI003B214963
MNTSRVCFLLVIVTITISVTTAAFIYPDDWEQEDDAYELDNMINPYVKRAMVDLQYEMEKRGGYGPCIDILTGKKCRKCDKKYKKYDHKRYRFCKSNPFVDPGYARF